MAERELTLKKSFTNRSILFLVTFVYIGLFGILISFRNIVNTYQDLLNKDTFEKVKLKIDTTYTSNGGVQGAYNNSYAFVKLNNKKLYLSSSGNVSSNFIFNQDSLVVLTSPFRKEYVYLDEINIWEMKLQFLIFRIIYIHIGIILFYFVRKQHRKVKQLAPYGVDEHFNPLPKPEEKFNYNKYEKD